MTTTTSRPRVYYGIPVGECGGPFTALIKRKTREELERYGWPPELIWKFDEDAHPCPECESDECHCLKATGDKA